MTPENNKKIAEALCGYRIHISPSGEYKIITDEGVRAMPDFETDWHEAMTTLIAVCRSKGWSWQIGGRTSSYCMIVGFLEELEYGNSKPLSAIANCLLQIAEGE